MCPNNSSEELSIFGDFARVAAPDVDLKSVEKRSPPEPDLICHDGLLGVRAFELLELLGSKFARECGQSKKTKDLLRNFVETVTPERRKNFESKFYNAVIHITYRNRSNLNQRRYTFPFVLDTLLALPDGFTGSISEFDPESATHLQSIRILRGDFADPIVDIESSGWAANPPVSKIFRKFTKMYVSLYPIELLAYINRNPTIPGVTSLKDLQNFLRTQNKPFPFRMIWVFDAQAKKNNLLF